MRLPQYDIFAGIPGTGDVLWKEAVEGLGAAYGRMKELAKSSPGSYFVFYSSTGRILAHIDSNESLKDGTSEKRKKRLA